MLALLRSATKEALADPLPLEDTADGWVFWFGKRHERYLKDAAKLGYSEATIDLPYQIAISKDLVSLRVIQTGVRELLPGFQISFVEDECQGKDIVRLLVSWSSPP